jgi:hypothetical protein
MTVVSPMTIEIGCLVMQSEKGAADHLLYHTTFVLIAYVCCNNHKTALLRLFLN